VVVATVATGTNPQGVDFSADSSKAYVTNASTTSVIDMGSLTVIGMIASLPSGTCAVGATMNMNRGDQGRVYVASNTLSGVVNVVDVGTNEIVESFSVGVRPLGIGIRTWPK
jgi:YVTN family beta-propeller protein